MKKTLVIFLHQNIWDQSSWEALEVEKYKKTSNVVAYELGYFINKNLVSAFKNKLNKKEIKKIFTFLKWKKDFFTLLKKYKNKKILIINKVKPTNLWGLLVLFELSKLKLNIVEYQNSGVPVFYAKKTIKEKIKIIFNLQYFHSLIMKRFYYLLSKFLKFYNYSYLISGIPNNNLDEKEILHGTSWDMAKTFLKNKRLNIKHKFAVYIESTIAHNGDQIFLGPNAANIDKKRWFKNLNIFFDFLEKNYNLKIIIAAHPKVNHKKSSRLYKKRKIIKNKTKELVLKSTLVLLERSSAINFVVRFNKPAAMIYNNDTISTAYNEKIHRGYSALTGIRNINIEKFSKNDFQKLFLIHKAKYLKFYKKFINYKNLKISNYVILTNKFLKNTI